MISPHMGPASSVSRFDNKKHFKEPTKDNT